MATGGRCKKKICSPLRYSKHFPSFQDLPEDNDLNWDYYGDGITGVFQPLRHWCFLGEITNDDTAQYSFLRNRVWVRDVKEHDNIPVAFYPEDGAFDFTGLKTGNTLCIRYAESHRFLDLTFGIREEHLNFAMTIRANLATLLEISDFNPKAKTAECWSCGAKEAAALKKCGKCRMAQYCNKECQTNDWVTRHKKWCKAMPGFMKLTAIDYGHWDGHYISFQS